MRAALRLIGVAAFALFLVSVGGCQFSYPFELSGVVRATDGAPLPGVTVTLKAGGISESPFPLVTGDDGTFKGNFRIADREFMRDELPTWSLKLSKDGYESATVDVSPKQEPESPRTKTFITVVWTLKAK
jgi:hypothetical protein